MFSVKSYIFKAKCASAGRNNLSFAIKLENEEFKMSSSL